MSGKEFYEPVDASKPHLFIDVDGVINLAKNSYPGLESASVILNRGTYMERQYKLYWQEKIVKQLRMLTNNEVELVWLTTWREDAVTHLDPIWGLNSRGFLNWEQKMSDHSQVFKGLALSEWADKYPNIPIIWVDDVAIGVRPETMRKFQHRTDVFTISPDSAYGLQESHLLDAKKFLDGLK